jgi:hypothetical protein
MKTSMGATIGNAATELGNTNVDTIVSTSVVAYQVPARLVSAFKPLNWSGKHQSEARHDISSAITLEYSPR